MELPYCILIFQYRCPCNPMLAPEILTSFCSTTCVAPTWAARPWPAAPPPHSSEGTPPPGRPGKPLPCHTSCQPPPRSGRWSLTDSSSLGLALCKQSGYGAKVKTRRSHPKLALLLGLHFFFLSNVRLEMAFHKCMSAFNTIRPSLAPPLTISWIEPSGI